MNIFTITITRIDKIICDEINIGLIFIDNENNIHSYISYEKLDIIKNLFSIDSFDRINRMIDNMKNGIKLNYIDYKNEIFLNEYFNISPFLKIKKVNWLNTITEEKFENKLEMYEFFFKHFIYDNIRAEKLRNIIND